MSYSVRLSDEVIRKISGWRPSSRVIRELFEGLEKLTENPAQKLIRIGPPHDLLQYDVVVREPGNPPRDYLFVLTVVYSADEETLHVVECDLHTEDRLGTTE